MPFPTRAANSPLPSPIAVDQLHQRLGLPETELKPFGRLLVQITELVCIRTRMPGWCPMIWYRCHRSRRKMPLRRSIPGSKTPILDSQGCAGLVFRPVYGHGATFPRSSLEGKAIYRLGARHSATYQPPSGIPWVNIFSYMVERMFLPQDAGRTCNCAQEASDNVNNFVQLDGPYAPHCGFACRRARISPLWKLQPQPLYGLRICGLLLMPDHPCLRTTIRRDLFVAKHGASASAPRLF
jgi:hypothetical protein